MEWTLSYQSTSNRSCAALEDRHHNHRPPVDHPIAQPPTIDTVHNMADDRRRQSSVWEVPDEIVFPPGGVYHVPDYS
jgi:hypothetical protein